MTHGHESQGPHLASHHDLSRYFFVKNASFEFMHLSKNGLESVVLPITSNECSERKSNFR